jgi:hypothetical protein
VRSANLEIHQKYERTIGFKPHSNILRLPNDCKVVSGMKLQESKANKALDKEILSGKSFAGHPVILGHITSNSEDIDS